jgi:thioesterase domain-containing protein/acyl carrier protein
MNQFEDPVRDRENSPFLTAERWPEVLAAAGFDRTSVFPNHLAHISGFGQHVLLAGKIAADRGGKGLEHDALKRFLGKILPSYSIPATFTQWDNLPMTSNGKIDRRALSRSDATSDEPRQEAQKRQATDPRNAAEKGLVEIWKELFQREKISIHDNFFEIGGDSLILVQLADGIRRRFGDGVQETLKMNRILEAPTIAELTTFLTAETELDVSRNPIEVADTQPTPVVFMNPEVHLMPFFCVHDGTITLHTLRHLPQYFHFHRPLYGFETKNLDAYHSQKSEHVVQSLAKEYIDALQKLQPHGPYLVGGYCMGGAIAFEIARMLEEKGETVARLVIISSGPPSTWVEDEVVLPFMFTKMWGVQFEKFGLHFDTNDGEDLLNILFESGPDGIPYGYLAERFRKEPYRSTTAAYRYARLEAIGLEERLRKFYRALSDSVPNFGAISFDQFKMVYKSYRTSFNGAARFRPGTFPGTIDFIRPAQAQYRLAYKSDVVDFWEARAQNGIRVTQVTGGNLSCLEEPHISYTAHAISTILKSSGY